MTWGEALLGFASIFLAGLVAFYLDSLRERRARDRWVREYLGFWRRQLETFEDEKARNRALFDRVETALSAWTSDDEGGSEPRWDDVDALSFSSAISMTPALFGEAMSAVPPELLATMFELDAIVPGLTLQSDTLVRLYESEIRPLAMTRTRPLSASQRRFVAQYGKELAAAWSGFELLYTKVDLLLRQLSELARPS